LVSLDVACEECGKIHNTNVELVENSHMTVSQRVYQNTLKNLGWAMIPASRLTESSNSQHALVCETCAPVLERVFLNAKVKKAQKALDSAKAALTALDK
jgi:hypothetical protein